MQESAGSASPAPSPSPRAERAPHWTDGTSRESRATAAYAAAEEARQQQLRDQAPQSTPGAPPATGEKVTIGKYELSEAEVGELLTAKAAEDSRKLTLPPNAEAYEPKLPADFVAPPGIELKIDTKDPLFGQAQQFAHRHKLSQDQFSEMLGLYGNSKIEAAQLLDRARAAEAGKLGAAGSARVTAVQTFLKGQLGSDLAGKMNMMIITADIVSGFETLMSRFSNQGGGAFSQAHRVAPDDASKIPGYDKMNFIQRRAAQDDLQRKR